MLQSSAINYEDSYSVISGIQLDLVGSFKNKQPKLKNNL